MRTILMILLIAVVASGGIALVRIAKGWAQQPDASRAGTAPGLDLPEQILPGGGNAASAIGADQIGAAADATSGIEQPEGAGDLCDPDTGPAAQAERERLKIDCDALRAAQKDGSAPRAGSADDPLLQPAEPDQREEFRNLGLGEDVPATVILQK